MVTFTRFGSIFDSEAQCLVNPVNCVGTMGAGLARQFKERFPAMYRTYASDCRKKLYEVGTVRFWEGDDCWIANFPTKDHWRNSSQYEWIESGLVSLREQAEGRIQTLALPAIGCGYGELDYGCVKELITGTYSDWNIPILVYDPK